MLRWDHTLKRGRYKVVSRTRTTPPKSFMWEPSQATLDIGLCTSIVVERVPPQGAPTLWEPKVPSVLTGGRKKSLRLLSEDEQMVQLEEAYARATVAITRARSLCLIMGPLDMKGLLGAATVMGTLMYGAGHVWEGQAHFYLHDGELSRAPPDETFIHMPRQNCSLTGPHFPPPAIVEALQDYVTHYYKVRRLHLIVVDLWRPLEVQHCPSQGNH